MRKTKLALFDLDGTLFDTTETNYFAYKTALAQYGYSLDHEYFRSYCNGRHYLSFLPQIVPEEEPVLREIHALKKSLYRSFLEKARPNWPLLDIAHLIQPLYNTAVVTTASRENCEQLLCHFGVIDRFDRIFSQEDVKRGKPDPEGFLLAMASFSATPENTVIFEDSEAGIQAAEAAGAGYYIVKGYN